MRGLSFPSVGFFALALCAAAHADTLVPAGTLLQCTVSEPNLSSQTAAKGDPILCDVSPLARFSSRTVLPYGAYLAGRFEDYSDPGHFVGKGWMELTFDRLVIGQDRIVPISAKVVKAPGHRVDKTGKIVGSGHATRDTVEWMIPVLWPEKVITLPFRGPRPVLKQETRLTLKIMDDFLVPPELATRSAITRPAYPPAPAPREGFGVRREHFAPISTEAFVLPGSSDNLTIMVLKDGTSALARDYWMQDTARIMFVLSDGTSYAIPIQAVDLPMTVAANRRRGVAFSLRYIAAR